MIYEPIDIWRIMKTLNPEALKEAQRVASAAEFSGMAERDQYTCAFAFVFLRAYLSAPIVLRDPSMNLTGY